MVVLEMKGGVLVQKFLRYRVYESYDIYSISIRSWIMSRGTAALTQSVICGPVAAPPYGVNFFGTQTEYISVKSLSMATLSHSVLIEYIKSTQGHMLRSIPIVHSGNSAHSGKQTHRLMVGFI